MPKETPYLPYLTGEYTEDVFRNVVEGRFYGDKVGARPFYAALTEFIEAGDRLDIIKKATIYGKDFPVLLPPCSETAEEAGYAERVPADIIHAIIGMATEVSEIVEALLKAIEGEEELDLVNLQEEFGDVLWYMVLGATKAGFNLDGAAKANTAKLRARYPDNFTNEAALNRDVDNERKVLEDSVS